MSSNLYKKLEIREEDKQVLEMNAGVRFRPEGRECLWWVPGALPAGLLWMKP